MAVQRCLLIAGLLGAVTACGPVSPLEIELTPRRERVTWGGLGVGVGSAGWSAQMDLARVRGGRVFRARWNIQGDDGNWSGNTPQSVSELAVLAGRGRICCGDRHWASYAIGGGLLTGSKGRSPAKEFTTVGVAGELMFITGRTPHVGMSLHGNLNPELPFIGVNVAILIGRMPFISSARGPRRPW